MNVAVLFSGGKDSVRTVHWCQENGHKVKYLVTLKSKNPDSYMFHTCNIDRTELQAEAMGIPLMVAETRGIKEEELEDLEDTLRVLNIDAIACGGIASNYQKERIDSVAENLEIKSLCPFWKYNPEKYMQEIIDLGFDVRIVGVVSKDLGKKWLGRKIDKESLQELKEMSKLYGKYFLVGEGGEFETYVVNGPNFYKKIGIVEADKIWDHITDSGKYIIKKAILI